MHYNKFIINKKQLFIINFIGDHAQINENQSAIKTIIVK